MHDSQLRQIWSPFHARRSGQHYGPSGQHLERTPHTKLFLRLTPAARHDIITPMDMCFGTFLQWVDSVLQKIRFIIVAQELQGELTRFVSWAVRTIRPIGDLLAQRIRRLREV